MKKLLLMFLASLVCQTVYSIETWEDYGLQNHHGDHLDYHGGFQNCLITVYLLKQHPSKDNKLALETNLDIYTRKIAADLQRDISSRQQSLEDYYLRLENAQTEQERNVYINAINEDEKNILEAQLSLKILEGWRKDYL